MNPIRALWVAVLIFVLGGAATHAFLAAQTSGQSLKGQQQPAMNKPLDLEKGKEMFAGNCSGCHGAQGGGGDAPDIQQMPAKLGDEGVATIIRRGVTGTGMPAFYGLDNLEALQIAAYLHSLSPTVPAEAIKGDPEKGQMLYQQSGCPACHIVHGQGGEIGPDLSNIGAMHGVGGLREALLNPGADLPKEGNLADRGRWTQFLMFRAVTKDGQVVEGMRMGEDSFGIVLKDAAGNFHPIKKLDLQSLEKEPGKSFMPTFKNTLSPADLDNLVAYLASLKGAQ